MAIILPHPLTPQEIRILQEFRRISAESVPMTTLKAVKHPIGGGEAPVRGLVEKGYLTADATGEIFTLTEKAREFLAIDYKPAEEGGAADAAAAE